MKDKAKRAVLMLVRIVSALAIGHVAFFALMITLPLRTGLVVSEMGCLCLSMLAFYMLRVRHWRFWVAVAIGVVLWFATMGVQVYTDPLYDDVSGYTRYIGLPLPAHTALVPGGLAQPQEVRHRLGGSFVGRYRFDNCLSAGNRCELVRTPELAVAAWI